MKYRPEIDGLRAVAVLPVILFHAGFSTFSGGFVGVDVFFVISGYLITSIILKDLEAGSFSFWEFYERRARRILPALFFVIICCIPFAWMWMMPMELKAFSASVVAVSVFMSNILFWRQSGYFDTAAELKPLLHTWSLAVEEQFYIFFPIAMLILWRFGRRNVVGAIAVVAVVSIALSEYGSRYHPSFNFYWLPTRAWELAAGSLCAFVAIKPKATRDDLLSVAGLAAIVFAVFYYDETTPFPSLYALLPVLGTCAIILFARQGTIVGSLLSLKAFVGIGLISYSAYLWHQPLFALARIRSLTEPSYLLMASLAVASLVLAYFSWRYIEVPARKRGALPLPTRKTVFALSTAVASLFIAFGLVGHFTKGFPARLTQQELALLGEGNPIGIECEQVMDCIIGDPSGEDTGFAFVGDSHMGRYAYALDMELKKSKKKATLLSVGWCPPILNFTTSDKSKNADICANKFQTALAEIIDDPKIHTLVLAAEWANYTTGARYQSSTSAYDFSLNEFSNSYASNNPEEFKDGFIFTIDSITKTGKKVFVITPVPEYDFDVPYSLIKRERWAVPETALRLSRDDYNLRNQDVFPVFDSVSEQVVVVDVISGLCDADYCYPFDEARLPLYNDGNHLSQRGLNKVMPIITRAIGL